VTPRLHIVTWLWRGWRPVYDRRDINAVATMLREKGGLPFGTRILLLTDQPTDWYAKRTEALGVETYPLWPDPVPRMGANRPNCFRRLKLFSRKVQESLGIAEGDIVMSMDADSVIQGDVAHLVAPLVTNAAHFTAMEGVAARIHGSLFAFRAGEHENLWTTFHPIHSPIALLEQPRDGTCRPIGSDQAWLTRHVKGEFLWKREHGCYSWNRHGCLLSPRYTENAVYWSFAGHNKPSSELVRQVRPDLWAAWQAAYNRVED
jgi:hypothetical protein